MSGRMGPGFIHCLGSANVRKSGRAVGEQGYKLEAVMFNKCSTL